MSLVDIFAGIYRNNGWSGRQSRSGTGSDLEETEIISKELPKTLELYDVKSMLDIPCGDFHWMRQVELPKDFKYIGADIVPDIINDIKYNHKQDKRLDFKVLNIIEDELPQVDLIFVRDCLGHLSNANVEKAVANIKRAKPKYLMATHWSKLIINSDIEDGSWRPINMNEFLGDDFEMIAIIKEDYPDKSMGLWRLK